MSVAKVINSPYAIEGKTSEILSICIFLNLFSSPKTINILRKTFVEISEVWHSAYHELLNKKSSFV